MLPSVFPPSSEPLLTGPVVVDDTVGAVVEEFDASADFGVGFFVADEGCVVADEGCVVADEGCVVADEGCVVADEGCVVADKGCVVADEGCVVADEGCAVADEGCVVADVVFSAPFPSPSPVELPVAVLFFSGVGCVVFVVDDVGGFSGLTTSGPSSGFGSAVVPVIGFVSSLVVESSVMVSSSSPCALLLFFGVSFFDGSMASPSSLVSLLVMVCTLPVVAILVLAASRVLGLPVFVLLFSS